ncbi:hypothetical protein GBA52_025047 [Prunus armeniaca]|nr:hypothetical protein GBA52_025047 [Prunus armeniaca]
MGNRLKQFLPEIISPAQNAFVPNRQIQDNILLAHEAFHLLKLRKSTKLYALGMKLDINKVYDRVEWNFLEAMMRKLGFANKWVRLIMSLVKSVELALVINGKPGSYFKSTRGIRQGDPLSPYLLLFVRPSPNPTFWTASDAHVIKVNFDDAWLASSGKAGAGLIAQNANGEFVGAKCLSFQAESAIMAKAIAGLEGCKWASELGLSEVCFESDSKELVESVKGNIKRGRWNLYPLLSRIHECNFIFSNCNWAWTGRKNNEAADHLASLALSRSSPEVWVSRPPTSLVHILNRDGLPCPPRAST